MDETVSTVQGEVRGLVQADFTQFRGIPYAKPPIGSRRFRKPQVMDAWKGIRDAKRFPASSIQDVGPMNPVGNVSEDCLYLNLWTPAADSKKRPVMVWVHGGSFVSGSASMPQYSGESLCRRGDVLVVNINYRLGILGFAYLKEEYGDRVDMNLGLWDQLAALEWIYENIVKFGGDPDNVTLFGESAGAACIAALLTSPKIKGLVKNAIIQSGSPDYVLQAQEAERLRALCWPLLELKENEDIWNIPAERFLKAQRFCLKQLVQRGDYDVPMPLFGMSLVPVFGDDLLPVSPLEYYAEKGIDGVNILIGTMADEWALFLKVPQGGGGSTEKYKNLDKAGLKKLFERSLPGRSEEALFHYLEKRQDLNETSEDYSERLLDLYGDFESDKAFGVPSVRIAEYQSGFHHAVFHYLCTWDKGSFGAAHAAELPLIFGDVDSGIGRIFTGGGEEAAQLSVLMQDAWIAFARTGRPATPALGSWPAYESDRRVTMELGARCGLRENLRAQEYVFWKNII